MLIYCELACPSLKDPIGLGEQHVASAMPSCACWPRSGLTTPKLPLPLSYLLALTFVPLGLLLIVNLTVLQGHGVRKPARLKPTTFLPCPWPIPFSILGFNQVKS